MEHAFAVEHHLVERYLLKEMPPDLNDEFEDHYFGCIECAADLRETDEFLKAIRIELQRPQLIAKPSPSQEARTADKRGFGRNLLQWRPAFAIAAMAACMVVVLYQNAVTLPHLRSQVAALDQPEVFPSLSLVGGSSRGGSVPTVALNGAKALLLQVDIPAQDRFTKYLCTLYSPEHRAIWTLSVSPDQAKDTVTLRAPLSEQDHAGVYSLQVQGIEPTPGTAAVDLTNYSFHVSTGR